jgi:hypothetical protein
MGPARGRQAVELAGGGPEPANDLTLAQATLLQGLEGLHRQLVQEKVIEESRIQVVLQHCNDVDRVLYAGCQRTSAGTGGSDSLRQTP